MLVIHRIPLFLAILIVCVSPADASEEYSAVEELLFTGDPAPDPKTVAVWNRDVLWKSATGDTNLLEEIRAAIADVNSALHRSPVKIREAGDKPPKLHINFVAPEKLTTMAGKRIKFLPGRVGNTITLKTGDGSIGIASISIANNLPERTRYYVLRHELMHAMGVPKHTKIVYGTIMRRNWRTSAAPVKLLAFDRKLLGFLYNGSKSGLTRRHFRQAFDRDWAKPAP